MKIRTQLVLAFLLLAILPLTGIVLYSYVSSLRAVRRAAETEVGSLSREMEGRMAKIRGELGRGVERIGEVPLHALLSAARSSREGKGDPLLGRLLLGFGEAVPFLQSVELVPEPPPADQRPDAQPVPPAHGVPDDLGRLSDLRTMVLDVAQVLREAKQAAEAAPQADAQVLKAFEVAVENLEPPSTMPPPPPEAPPVPDSPGWSEEIRQRIEAQLAAKAEAAVEKQSAALIRLGRSFEIPMRERGRVVGKVRARVRGDEVLRRVLARDRSGAGEIAFAIDAEGDLHTASPEDRATIERLPIAPGVHSMARSARWVLDDWVVATSKDPESGLVFGIARPVPLAEVRQTAARNFGYGLGLIGLALLGILPLSTRITRNLRLVTQGADRIAQGDLDARIPVRSKNELGTLALTFNRMAEDLKRHQEREIEQALLQTEYERKTRDLEEARSFQLSLLPKTLPEHPGFEIAVSMRTATEVGGDYYDFHLSDDGVLTAAIGDATGHGARAGTMVTAVKSLFSADAGASSPRQFLAEAARAVKRMELGRMAMGLCLVRLEGSGLTLSSAGMPPLLLYRARTGRADETALAGMPLGGLAFDYQERRSEIDPGDTILLMTDGLPELTNGEGDPLGYPRVRALFESLGEKPPEEIIAGLAAAAESWSAGQAPKDDITFVVIRARVPA